MCEGARKPLLCAQCFNAWNGFGERLLQLKALQRQSADLHETLSSALAGKVGLWNSFVQVVRAVVHVSLSKQNPAQIGIYCEVYLVISQTAGKIAFLYRCFPNHCLLHRRPLNVRDAYQQ